MLACAVPTRPAWKRLAHGINAAAGVNCACWQALLAGLLWLVNRMFVTAPIWSPVATLALIAWVLA